MVNNMFWKSYIKTKLFLFMFCISLGCAIITSVCIIFFAPGDFNLYRLIVGIVSSLVIFGLLFYVFSLSYKHNYNYWVPKYYIMHGRYYFTGNFLSNDDMSLVFSDDINDAELYISTKKVNALIQLFKEDYSIDENTICIKQLNFKEAYERWAQQN